MHMSRPMPTASPLLPLVLGLLVPVARSRLWLALRPTPQRDWEHLPMYDIQTSPFTVRRVHTV